MSFRITTYGMFRNYRQELNSSYKNLNTALQRVETQRKVNSYADDPAAASQSFQMRRNFWRAGDQIDNTEHLISKFSTGWDALDYICDGTDEHPGLSSMRESLIALNGTSGTMRRTLGTDIITMSESMMEAMNVRYGDEFVFAGADCLNVPFTLGDKGQLQYRGVDVDTDMKAPPAESEWALDAEGKYKYSHNADGTLTDEGKAAFDAYKAGYESSNSPYQYEQGLAAAQFRVMAEEHTYVDIGLGFQVDDSGQVVPSSAFDSSLPGISYLGYGLDEDGDPKNIISLMREIGGILRNCDENTGAFASDEDEQRVNTLTMKLKGAIFRIQDQHTSLDARVSYLKKNKEQLENTKDRMNEQIVDFETLEPAEAIMDLNWAQYCYNASLKVGTTLLSQSLIDYMN